MGGITSNVTFYMVRSALVAYVIGAITLDGLPPSYDYLLGAARQAYARSDARAFDACVFGVMSLIASEVNEGGDDDSEDSILP